MLNHKSVSGKEGGKINVSYIGVEVSIKLYACPIKVAIELKSVMFFIAK